MPTGGYFLFDAAKTFAAQENWQIRDGIIQEICPIYPLFFGQNISTSIAYKEISHVLYKNLNKG